MRGLRYAAAVGALVLAVAAAAPAHHRWTLHHAAWHAVTAVGHGVWHGVRVVVHHI